MINNLPPFSQVWLLTVFKPHSLFPLWTSWWESLILLPLVPSGDSNHESPTYIGETSVWPHPLSHSENPEPVSYPCSLGPAWEACPALPKYISYVSNNPSNTIFRCVCHHKSQSQNPGWESILQTSSDHNKS